VIFRAPISGVHAANAQIDIMNTITPASLAYVAMLVGDDQYLFDHKH